MDMKQLMGKVGTPVHGIVHSSAFVFFPNLALWLVLCPGNLMLLAVILRFSMGF